MKDIALIVVSLMLIVVFYHLTTMVISDIKAVLLKIRIKKINSKIYEGIKNKEFIKEVIDGHTNEKKIKHMSGYYFLDARITNIWDELHKLDSVIHELQTKKEKHNGNRK